MYGELVKHKVQIGSVCVEAKIDESKFGKRKYRKHSVEAQ